MASGHSPSSEHAARIVRLRAVACCQALTAEVECHEAIYIAADDIRFDAPTERLLREFAPSVKVRQPLAGSDSVISVEKAKRLLGFRPQHTWRNLKPAENS